MSHNQHVPEADHDTQMREKLARMSGQLATFFRNLPTEAILRVDILPEEAALKYGFSANQSVVNIVLKDHVDVELADLQGGAATEGDGGEAVDEPARLAGPPAGYRLVQDLDGLLRNLEVDLTLPEGELEGGQQPRLVVELLRGVLEGSHPLAGGQDLVNLGLGKLGLQFLNPGLGLRVGYLQGALVALQEALELLADLRPVADGGDQVRMRLAKAGGELRDLLVGDEVGLEQVLDVGVRDELGIHQSEPVFKGDGLEALPARLLADGVDAEGDQ